MYMLMRRNHGAFGKKNAPKGADCGSIAEDVLKAADLIITPSDQERLVVRVQRPNIGHTRHDPVNMLQDRTQRSGTRSVP
jgi:hypothetical protein